MLPPLVPRRVHVSIMDATPCATPTDGAAPKPEPDKLAGMDALTRRITAAKEELEALRTAPCLAPCRACSSRAADAFPRAACARVCGRVFAMV